MTERLTLTFFYLVETPPLLYNPTAGICENPALLVLAPSWPQSLYWFLCWLLRVRLLQVACSFPPPHIDCSCAQVLPIPPETSMALLTPGTVMWPQTTTKFHGSSGCISRLHITTVLLLTTDSGIFQTICQQPHWTQTCIHPFSCTYHLYCSETLFQGRRHLSQSPLYFCSPF